VVAWAVDLGDDLRQQVGGSCPRGPPRIWESPGRQDRGKSQPRHHLDTVCAIKSAANVRAYRRDTCGPHDTRGLCNHAERIASIGDRRRRQDLVHVGLVLGHDEPAAVPHVVP